jgi:hypothetical protein
MLLFMWPFYNTRVIVSSEGTIFWDVTDRSSPTFRKKYLLYRVEEKAKQAEGRFESLTTVIMTNTISWDVTPCSLAVAH